MPFAKRVRTLREERGLTQEALAEEVGVSRQTISKWESGQAMPDLVNLMELCKTFNVSTDTLLHGVEGTKEKKAIRYDLIFLTIGFISLLAFMGMRLMGSGSLDSPSSTIEITGYGFLALLSLLFIVIGSIMAYRRTKR